MAEYDYQKVESLLITLPMTTIGQRIFQELGSEVFKTPGHGLEWVFNITHGEFHCKKADNFELMYLSSNTIDIRWAYQIPSFVGYGPNPWAAMNACFTRCLENFPSVVAPLVDIAVNEGCCDWKLTTMPFHVEQLYSGYSIC
jgi:hypothetical protein